MDFETNENKIPAALVMRFRKATGLAVMRCKHYLQTTDPELVQRILLAYDQRVHLQMDHYLRDLIEYDPLYLDAFAQASNEARLEVEAWTEAMRKELRERGMEVLEFMLSYKTQHYWHVKQRILREKFHIDWKTPTEMNPAMHFD